MTNTRYTKNLLKLGEERTRLTKQLAELVGTVANEIANIVPTGTEVDVVCSAQYAEPIVCTQRYTRTLRVIERNSNVGGSSFLAIEVVDEDDFVLSPRYEVFEPGYEPGSSYYLHGDFNAVIKVADRDDYLWFANNLPAILTAFEGAEEDVIAALRSAFDTLKKVAEVSK